MKAAFKFIALYCCMMFSKLVSFSQQNTKLPVRVVKSSFSREMWWMTAVIVVLLLLIILMPKTVRRTTVYVKDENGNIKPVTQTVIRGRKTHSE